MRHLSIAFAATVLAGVAAAQQPPIRAKGFPPYALDAPTPALAVWAACAAPPQPPITEKVSPPYVVVTPSPALAGDALALWYVKDTSHNSCTPNYSNETFSIEASDLAVWPPLYIVHLSYREWPHNVDTTCIAVRTEYGPRYSLPNVAIGNYTVMDGDSVVGSFGVAQGSSVSGIVTDDPGTTRRMSIPLADVLVSISTPPMYIVYAAIPIVPPYQYYYDTTRTAADGAFRFAAVPQDYYQLTFSKSGYATQSIPLSLARDTTGILVKMLPEGTVGSVSGTVTTVICPFVPPCVDMPVPQCTVGVSFGGCLGDIYPLQSAPQGLLYCPSYRAVTDSLGRFVIDSLPLSRSGERIYVSVYKPGYAAQSVDTAVYYMVPTQVSFSLDWVGVATAPDRGAAQAQASPVASYSRATNSIVLQLPSAQRVSLTVLGLDGRRIAQVAPERMLSAGAHTFAVGEPSSAGVRLVHIHGTTYNQTLRICR
jgi:hypothetical protein